MRDITTTAETASNAELVRAILMVDLEYRNTTPIYLHTGIGEINNGGKLYQGIGDFGSVSNVTEDTELGVSSITMQLSGVKAANIATALGVDYQGDPTSLYIALLDDNNVIIPDPVLLFRGRMDSQVIDLGQESMITLTVNNRMADWDRPRVRRYNHDDQQVRFPGDKGLEFVEQAADKEVVWGRA